jgi:hypothetical protein
MHRAGRAAQAGGSQFQSQDHQRKKKRNALETPSHPIACPGAPFYSRIVLQSLSAVALEEAFRLLGNPNDHPVNVLP